MIKGTAIQRLIEAVLDQPNPTPGLKAALQFWLTRHKHVDRDLAVDGLQEAA